MNQKKQFPLDDLEKGGGKIGREIQKGEAVTGCSSSDASICSARTPQTQAGSGERSPPRSFRFLLEPSAPSVAAQLSPSPTTKMATMENVIELVNRIQRACTVLGDHGGGDVAALWEALPSVAVVGGQVRLLSVTSRRLLA